MVRSRRRRSCPRSPRRSTGGSSSSSTAASGAAADVIRALALGARAVLIGRPFLWGLAIDGQAGQRPGLPPCAHELEEDARLCGIPDMTAVPRELVRLSKIGLR